MSEEFEEPVVAYMAIQFKGMPAASSWPETTWGKEMSEGHRYNPTKPKNPYDVLPINATDATKGPPSITAYSPLRTMQWSIKREYDGSPSGGSPVSATRGEPSDIFLQRSVDQISPILMQYGFTGMQLANVHLVYAVVSAESTAVYITWIRLTDAVITGYYYDTKTEEAEEGGVASVDHYETLTIWYSTINFQSYTTTKGWDSTKDTTIG